MAPPQSPHGVGALMRAQQTVVLSMCVMKILCCCLPKPSGRRHQTRQQLRARFVSRQARTIRPANSPSGRAHRFESTWGLTGRAPTCCAHAPRVVCVCSIRLFDPSLGQPHVVFALRNLSHLVSIGPSLARGLSTSIQVFTAVVTGSHIFLRLGWHASRIAHLAAVPGAAEEQPWPRRRAPCDDLDTRWKHRLLPSILNLLRQRSLCRPNVSDHPPAQFHIRLGSYLSADVDSTLTKQTSPLASSRHSLWLRGFPTACWGCHRRDSESPEL